METLVPVLYWGLIKKNSLSQKKYSYSVFPSRSINPYSAGIDFSRENLKSVDKVYLRTVRVEIYLMTLNP